MFKHRGQMIGYVAKTTSFYLVVGAAVGTSFMPPFLQTFTHRPFRFPQSLFELLLGFVIVGIPFAAFAGVAYGTCLAVLRLEKGSRAIWAFGCGCAPVIVLILATAIQTPVWSFDIPVTVVFVFLGMAMFTGFSSVVTAWLHWKAEQRFTFFRAPSK